LFVVWCRFIHALIYKHIGKKVRKKSLNCTCGREDPAPANCPSAVSAAARPAAPAGRRWKTDKNIYIKGRGIYGGEGCRGKRKVVVIRPGVAGKRRDCRCPAAPGRLPEGGWVYLFKQANRFRIRCNRPPPPLPGG
jgi:hypothetical protein